MWRDYPVGFPQVIAGVVFGGLVLVGVLLAFGGGDSPQMQIFRLSQELNDDFGAGAAGWQSPVFAGVDGALLGDVPAGAGFAVAVREVRPANVSIQAEAVQGVAPAGAVVNVGVLCRADAQGNGYYFLVSSSGLVSIQRALPGEADLTTLVDWVDHAAVRPLDEGNVLEAACVADYLRFSVNGVFVAQARDEAISRGDGVGVTLAGTGESGRIRAAFDDITVWEAAARR